MLTKDQFTKGFVILTRAYPRQEIPKGTADVYFSALNRRQVTPTEYEDAVNACIDTLKWFPTIAEIIAAIPKPSAEEAWEKVMQLAARGDNEDLLTYPERRALAIFGGLNRFGLTPYEDLNRRWRDFKSAYQEAVANPQADFDRIGHNEDRKQIKHEALDALTANIVKKYE